MTPVAVAAETASSRCVPVAPAVVRAISQGLTISGGGGIRGAKAVKSRDFSNVYFVSARLIGPGLDGSDTATWATNRIKSIGLIFSVDGFAKEFSDWGDGGQTDAHLSMNNDGAAESRRCARR